MTLYPKQQGVWDCEHITAVSEQSQTLWGRSRGFALLPEKRLHSNTARQWITIIQNLHIPAATHAFVTEGAESLRWWAGRCFRVVSDQFQTLLGGHSRGFALLPEKRLHSNTARQWITIIQNLHIPAATLTQRFCNRRSKESEMVSQKVFQSGFRAVSDPFGGALTGLCPVTWKEAALKRGRFGNQKPLGELRERKLIPPKESVIKYGRRVPPSNVRLSTGVPKRPFWKSKVPQWIRRT